MKRSLGLLLVVGSIFGCGFDDSLREYLSARFWLPFAKRGHDFEKRNVRRVDHPFAGMTADQRGTPLAKLRALYQPIAHPDLADNLPAFDLNAVRQAVTNARSDPSLSSREREEVELIDAKIDLRAADPDDDVELAAVEKKLQAFLKATRTPEFLSEARGWLARIYYLLGEQTAAGKIYLDELNRNGSNLSRETLLNSLRMNYRYDGGSELLDHLPEYFDTPEHAAFAIQLATNPHWDRHSDRFKPNTEADTYVRVRTLLQRHTSLLRSDALASLSMRTALRMGDPAAARQIADAIRDNARIRSEPDFLWMLASSDFLAGEYAAAEPPLLALFHSRRATDDQKAAAPTARELKPTKKAPAGARGAHVAPKKAKSGKKATSAKKVRKTAVKPKGTRTEKAAKEKGVREGSKTQTILDLLKRPGGVSAKELLKATNWQPHSLRGFLSGTVGKKMGLAVVSMKGEDGERSYSVKA